jgi:hypothetical protein
MTLCWDLGWKPWHRLGDGGHAEVDRAAMAGAPVDLGEFVLGPGEADA